MSTKVFLSDIPVSIETETDIEVKLERICEQVELSEMLDEYGSNSDTLEWVAENCDMTEVLDAMKDTSGFAEAIREHAANLPRDEREPTRETVGNGMGYKWMVDDKTRAVAVMRPHGTLTMNVLDNSDTLHTFVSDSIEGADLLVRWMVNAQ